MISTGFAGTRNFPGFFPAGGPDIRWGCITSTANPGSGLSCHRVRPAERPAGRRICRCMVAHTSFSRGTRHIH